MLELAEPVKCSWRLTGNEVGDSTVLNETTWLGAVAPARSFFLFPGLAALKKPVKRCEHSAGF